MLIGGIPVFGLIVMGALMVMRRQAPPAALTASPVMNAQASEAITPKISDPQAENEAFLAAAEPLAREFLNATRIEDLLPLVIQADVVQPKMRRHYGDGKIEALGLSGFNTQGNVTRRGNLASLTLATRAAGEKPICFVQTPHGLKIDWEAWVGWSEMPWEEFLAKKPTTAITFRVNLSEVDYYNFTFADDSKWQAYRIESPDATCSLYGYAERGTPLNSQLRPPPESKSIPLVLTLKFPPHATATNQVLIDQCLAVGWALETPSPP